MFIGYEIKSQQNQAKPIILENDIKLSQAALDPSKGGKKSEPVCLMVEYDNKQFILAVLDSTRSWQCPLDLMFEAGKQVKFFLRGSGSVHLTGFEIRDELSSDIEIDSCTDDEEHVILQPNKKPKIAVTRPVKTIPSPKTNGNGKAVKKDVGKKPAGESKQDSDQDEDDSDDEDFDSDMMDQDDDIEMSDSDEDDIDDDDDLDEDLEDEDDDDDDEE